MHIKDWIVNKMVSIRTSFTYVWVVVGIVLSWILLNRLHIVHWDNDDLTLLNLTLSVLAEIQGVILLIYATKITEAQKAASSTRDQHAADLMGKLSDVHKDIAK